MEENIVDDSITKIQNDKKSEVQVDTEQNPFQLHATTISSYTYKSLIGKKSEFFNLYVYESNITKILYPILRINRPKISLEIQQAFITELKIQRSLKHKALSPPLGYILPAKNSNNTGLYIIYDSQYSKTLKENLNELHLIVHKDDDKIKIDYVKAFKIILGIISGISFLHQNGMVHGDLRPATVILDNNSEPKLIDYNFPELYPNHLIDEKHNKSKYTAPELSKDYIVTKQSDIYSLGVLLLRIMLNNEDFNAFTKHSRMPNLRKEPKIIQILMKEILLCIEQDPSSRPSIFDVEQIIFNAFMTLTDEIPLGGLMDYSNSIVKYNPDCWSPCYSQVNFIDKINIRVHEYKKKLKPLKTIIPETFDFLFHYLKFQLILHNIKGRNIENFFTWIIMNMDLTKENICKMIADEILNSCRIRYNRLPIYAQLTNRILNYSLPENKVAIIKSYFLDTLKSLAITQDIYPNYASYPAFIYVLSNKGIYTEQELADIVKYIVEKAPSKTFAFLPFAWFHLATKNIYPELYDSLLKLMDEIDCQQAFKLFVDNPCYSTNSFADSIQQDNVTKFKKILKQKPDLINRPVITTVFDPCYLAHYEAPIPLYVAYFNASKIFIYLHSTGINMESTDKRGSNFYVASTVGDLNKYNEPTPLELKQKGQFEAAIEFQHPEFFDKVDFGELFYKEKFPLIKIGKHNSLFALVLLLSYTTNHDNTENLICTLLSSPGLFGQTILHAVVEYRRAAFLKVLLSFKKLDFNVKDSWGKTPLHYACQNCSTECARLLLERSDIDVNIKDEYMNSPIHYATINGSLEIISILSQSSKFDINSTNKKHQTALHISAKQNNLNIFKFLMEHKIDPSIVDHKGRTAYEIAVNRNFEDILSAAERYAVNPACRI